ncbi:MAG: thiamine-monophosphate kinase [Blastopirellula sp.]|nr:MAG: thiamine-monophosphate kinase [Blastopirellula sp.]
MERQLIDYLTKHLPSSDDLLVGIGDDAAILDWRTRDDLVVTSDMITDQIDFILADADPKLIGRKALAVNLSDLAAMAAQPVGVIVSLLLPSTHSKFSSIDPYELALQLYQGILPLAQQYDVVIAGGDTNCWNGPLAINITAFGAMQGNIPWLRCNAQAGDHLLVTGTLGGSILKKHFEFTPRVNEALSLRQQFNISTAMDISDGLSLDLSRICRASKVGVELLVDQIPISVDAQQLSLQDKDQLSPLEHALQDGEDFELLLAASPTEATRIIESNNLSCPITHIGYFTKELGLYSIDTESQRSKLVPQGFVHQ